MIDGTTDASYKCQTALGCKSVVHSSDLRPFDTCILAMIFKRIFFHFFFFLSSAGKIYVTSRT